MKAMSRTHSLWFGVNESLQHIKFTLVIFYLLPELVSWICDVDHIASNSENLFSKWRINEMKLVLFVKLNSLLEGGGGVQGSHFPSIVLYNKNSSFTGQFTPGERESDFCWTLFCIQKDNKHEFGTVTLENAGSSQIREAMTNVS